MKSNEQYMSLYEFRGVNTGVRISGLGKEVNTAAKAKGINIIYQELPEDKQKPDYKSVATYPVSFLNEYFNIAVPTILTIEDLSTRLIALESQFADLITKLDINVANSIESSVDDDLPF